MMNILVTQLELCVHGTKKYKYTFNGFMLGLGGLQVLLGSKFTL